MVSPEGLEPLFFVPPRLQTNKTGTHEQQVVTRVTGYSWCLAHAWHTARIYATNCCRVLVAMPICRGAYIFYRYIVGSSLPFSVQVGV